MELLTSLRRLSRSLPVGPLALHRLRRLAGHGFEALAWLAHGRSRKPARPGPGPVCVVGFHGSVLGIGEAARAFSESLRAAGGEAINWDVSALFGHDVRLGGDYVFTPPAEAGAFVLFLNPRELIQLMAMTGGKPFEGRFCVGAWAWELESAPKNWRGAFRYVDEAWACSAFVAGAVRQRAPAGFPVRVLPHPVGLATAQPDRAAFGLDPDKVVVLTAFDARSGFTRKNPLAAVRAFRRANRSGQGVLICKATGVEGAPDLIADLRSEIGKSGDVRFIDDWLTGAQMRALIASADIVLSLHRSEGFGLTPAHAMAAGKPVVATGWSGNTDFMSPADSALVGFDLVAVQDPQGLYRHGYWAEPDLGDAAAQLQALIEDQEWRSILGARAQAAVAARLDPAAMGRQALAWLEPAGRVRS